MFEFLLYGSFSKQFFVFASIIVICHVFRELVLYLFSEDGYSVFSCFGGLSVCGIVIDVYDSFS